MIVGRIGRGRWGLSSVGYIWKMLQHWMWTSVLLVPPESHSDPFEKKSTTCFPFKFEMNVS